MVAVRWRATLPQGVVRCIARGPRGAPTQTRADRRLKDTNPLSTQQSMGRCPPSPPRAAPHASRNVLRLRRSHSHLVRRAPPEHHRCPAINLFSSPAPPPRQTQSVKMSSGGSYHTPAADGSTPAAAAAGGAAAGAVRRHPTYPTAAPSASPRPEPVQSMTLLLVPTLLCRRHQQMAAVVRIQWQPLASSISGG